MKPRRRRLAAVDRTELPLLLRKVADEVALGVIAGTVMGAIFVSAWVVSAGW